jgi:hypothetical protein
MNEDICSRCDGLGYEEYYDEDTYRDVRDTCYHCGGCGRVDSETAYHDRLSGVAHSLAVNSVSELQKWINSNPDGEGWEFHAAENMMRGYEYFQVRVMDYMSDYLDRLMQMSVSDRELLIAWNEMPFQPVRKAETPKAECVSAIPLQPMYEGNDIPF